jgi:hypothetical protein
VEQCCTGDLFAKHDPHSETLDGREAFIPEVERLAREEKEASRRFYEVVPPVPEEMRMSEIGAHMAGVTPWYFVGRFGDSEVTWVTLEGWRHAVNRPLVPAEQGPMAPHMMVTHQRARAREILPIAERYEAAVAEASAACGRDAANAAYEAALDRKDAIDGAIFQATAETFGDLLIQVRACEVCGYTDDDGDPDSDEGNFPDWAGRALVRSIRSLAARGEGHINV